MLKQPNYTELKKIKEENKRKCYFCDNANIHVKRSFEYLYLMIHHIDGDRNNDSKENLMIICMKCHKRLHVKIYKRLGIKMVKFDSSLVKNN